MIGIPFAWYKARIPGFPRKSIKLWQGPESPKSVSCSSANQTCTGAATLHLPDSPTLARKTTCSLPYPSLIDSAGKSRNSGLAQGNPDPNNLSSFRRFWEATTPKKRQFQLKQKRLRIAHLMYLIAELPVSHNSCQILDPGVPKSESQSRKCARKNLKVQNPGGSARVRV